MRDIVFIGERAKQPRQDTIMYKFEKSYMCMIYRCRHTSGIVVARALD